MGSRQDPDLARNRPHRSRIAAVDAPSAAQYRAADDFLFDLLEQLQRQGALGLVGEQLGELRLGIGGGEERRIYVAFVWKRRAGATERADTRESARLEVAAAGRDG